MQEATDDDGGSRGGSTNPRYADDFKIAQAAAGGCEFSKALVVGEASLLRTALRNPEWWEDAIGEWIRRFLMNPAIIRGYTGESSLRAYLAVAIRRQTQSIRCVESKHHNLERLRGIRPNEFRNGLHGVLNAYSMDAAETRWHVCEHFNARFFSRDGAGRRGGLVAAARAGFVEEIVEQVVEVRIALADGECSDPSLGHRAEALLELIGWVVLSISQKPDRVRRYLHQRAAAARAEAYALEAALRAA
jgi:hypothetical protein